MPRSLAIAALSIASTLLAVNTAWGATIGSSQGVITFSAAPGELNSPTVDVSFDGTSFVLRDAKAPVTAGSGCSIPSPDYVPGDVYCPKAGVSRIRFLLGDGDDSILVYSSVPANVVTEIDAGPGGLQSIASESSGPTIVTGGPGADWVTTYGPDDQVSTGAGDDQIRTGAGHDTIDSGVGADEVHAGPGADTVQGGPDGDLLYGDAGMDELHGGGGDDALWGEQDADVLDGEDGNDEMHPDPSHEMGFAPSDVLRGGAGKDTANYNSRGGTQPVDISLDGAANDGAAGENDNVGPDGDVEVVKGSGNNDVLTGSDRAEELYGDAGDDRIDGRGGDDVLAGLFGSDQIAGGEGNDTIRGEQDGDAILGEGGNDDIAGGTGDDRIEGGSGADTIDGGLDSDTLLARDGVVDVIRCSMGRDSVEADTTENFADRSQCEGVAFPGAIERIETVFTVLVSPTLRLATVLRRGVVVRTTVPGPGRLTSVATMARSSARRVGLAAARTVTIGRGSASVTRSGSASVRVKLTAKAKRRLRRARRVTVTVRTTFRANDGRTVVSSRRITLKR